MSFNSILNILLLVIALIIISLVVYRRRPKRLKTDVFADKWKELQGFCRDKKTWPDAILEADKLLDVALRRRKYKGKSMGERMVSAQRMMTNNDGMWFAHNLAKKVIADPEVRLKESDVKTALIGFRQALKDLGALEVVSKPSESEVEQEGKK